VRGLTGGKGKVGEKVQELTAVTGVAGVEEERGSKGRRWCSGGRSAGGWQGSG
jgi:hypothetical protein